MTENQQKVYNFLKNNGCVLPKTIKRECGFKTLAPVIGSLQALRCGGYVECVEQILYDGSIMKFFRLVKEI